MRNLCKKGFWGLSLIICSFLIVSCEDFITLNPIDRANVENSFESVEDANRAVMGIYHALATGSYAQNMAILTELITDNAYSQDDRLKGSGSGDLSDVNEVRLTNENSYVENRWNRLYNGIARANLLLEEIEGIEFPDEEVKEQYIGESKFLRAFFYFDLVRFFGAVPVSLSEIKSTDDAFSLGREPEDYIYSDVIVKDLEDAIALLPASYDDDANLGRATEGAAKALLAKVYLTQGNDNLAVSLLQELTNSSYGYDLMAEYADVFDEDNTLESIFEIQYSSGSEAPGNPYPNWFLPTDGSAGSDVFGEDYQGGNGFGGVLPSTDLHDIYEENDPRRDYNIAEYFSLVEGAEIYRVDKYRGAPTSPGNSEDNIILLRYADVLLMLAEALNEINNGPTAEAYDAVDRIRIRAGLNPWERNLDYDSFKSELLEERRKEFAFENHRWFDLKRFEKAVDILSGKGYDIEPYELLFPLPRLEIEINANIEQNPGY